MPLRHDSHQGSVATPGESENTLVRHLHMHRHLRRAPLVPEVPRTRGHSPVQIPESLSWLTSRTLTFQRAEMTDHGGRSRHKSGDDASVAVKGKVKCSSAQGTSLALSHVVPIALALVAQVARPLRICSTSALLPFARWFTSTAGTILLICFDEAMPSSTA